MVYSGVWAVVKYFWPKVSIELLLEKACVKSRLLLRQHLTTGMWLHSEELQNTVQAHGQTATDPENMDYQLLSLSPPPIEIFD